VLLVLVVLFLLLQEIRRVFITGKRETCNFQISKRERSYVLVTGNDSKEGRENRENREQACDSRVCLGYGKWS